MEQIEQLITYPLQFLVAIIIVLLLELPIASILDSISHHIEIDPPAGIDPERWTDLIRIPGRHGGRWIGITERLLFFTALWVGAPILVGAWLAFKVASKWQSWSQLAYLPKPPASFDDQGMIEYALLRHTWTARRYVTFLVGTGGNILVGAFGVGLGKLCVQYS